MLCVPWHYQVGVSSLCQDTYHHGAASPGMQVTVSPPRCIAFPHPGSLGVWDGLCLEVTSLSLQAGWVFVPPSSAECKPTLCVLYVSQGSGAGLPELLGASSHDF